MESTTAYHLSPPGTPQTCGKGHRSTLIITTSEGGAICLLCFSNLISNPQSSPTIHISYALSQLSLALSQPHFLHTFLTFHSHFLVFPLVHLLSSLDDDRIADQTTDLIVKIVDHADDDVYGEFVSRVSDVLSSGSLAWSRKQLYTLHCLGILLDYERINPYVYVKDKYALVFNLVSGLQLCSDEIQGEILFLLYKISLLQGTYIDDDSADVLSANYPKLLNLSLQVLMKTQSDDVRLNCVALLKVLAQRCLFEYQIDNTSFEVDTFMQTTEPMLQRPPLNILFAEAVKGALLSSDSQVQIATLDLIFLYLSCKGDSGKCQVFVEENIADYVFEILRLSGCKDSLVTSCIQVLDLLSTAEQSFRQRLAVGFTTLVPILHYVVEIPFRPVQTQLLKLIWNCISNCPGAVSSLHFEEIGVTLTGLFKKHVDGLTGMLPETFTLACSILVDLMKCSWSSQSSSFLISIQNSSNSAVLICLSDFNKHPGQLLHSLYLVKEAYAYSHEGNLSSSSKMELRNCILDLCGGHILPWFLTTAKEIEDEDIALAVLETFHSILLQDSDPETKIFTTNLVSLCWFSFSFGCLGIFPTERMKQRIYLVFSSIVDVLLGNNSGELIRDAAPSMPLDPIDLLFLLGQKNFHHLELLSCQSAVLLVLYISSLYDDRIADDKLVLASLEQYILLNSNELIHGASTPVTLNQLVSLYGLYRGLAKMSYQIPYSPEAERILFQLLAEKDWDLLNTRIHAASLEWLFQQEKICNSLYDQLLRFCRCNSPSGNHMIIHGKDSQCIDVNAITELIASGNNFTPVLFIRLLGALTEDEQEDDLLSVVTVITKTIKILAGASDQLCVNGIGGAIPNIYYHSNYCSSPDVFVATSKLVCGLLQSVGHEAISDEEPWVAVVMKLLDYLIPTVTLEGWTQECLIVIGTLSLVLYLSTKQVLVEAAKTILLSTPLISTITNTIFEACSKGPALVDHDEGTRTGEVLVFLLLLLFFSSRSMHAVLPGILDWQNLFDEASNMQPISYISIPCHNLCKLMHYGSPVVKLIASYCLVDLFSKISYDESKKLAELKFRTGYLLSVMAILEGLVFFNDNRVSTNCALCLSMIMGWEDLNTELLVTERNQWCRLIVEEMVMSFAVPSLASKFFTIQHEPAVHVAVALLKMKRVPKWINTVLDTSCISGIIANLSASQITTEFVAFFRQLLIAGYLKAEQIASLNKLFQSCRKRVYTEEFQDRSKGEHVEKIVADPDDSGQVSECLINLMFYQSSLNMNSRGSHFRDSGLLEEIELFTKSLMEEDES